MKMTDCDPKETVRNEIYDAAVIGGGIVGASLFRELNRFQLKTILLEKENDVSLGASRANSAIVHAGYDPPAGSLMARFNVEGNKLYPKLCEELSVPFRQNGSLILAFGPEDRVHLQKLWENGQKNGVSDLELLTRDEVLALEPNLSPAIDGALWAKSGGIVGAYEMTTATAENGVANGGRLRLNAEVAAIRRVPCDFPSKKGEGTPDENFVFCVELADGEVIKTRFLLNAAGINADKINDLIAPHYFSIRPRKGAYFVLDKSEGRLFDRTLFVCPGPLGKGVLVSPTVHGNLIVGPDAEDGVARDDTATARQRLDSIRDEAKRMTSAIRYQETIRHFAGLRALSDQKDFIIEEAPETPRFFNFAGIKSPGLTSAPAIAKYAVGLLANAGLDLVEKKDFNPTRSEIRFASLSDAEKNELIRKRPEFGRIVCRCESITEGEIIDAIRRPAGATTLDGVKRRCRPGCGRCQGGFCSPRVLTILARELGRKEEEICQDKAGSYVVAGRIK